MAERFLFVADRLFEAHRSSLLPATLRCMTSQIMCRSNATMAQNLVDRDCHVLVPVPLACWTQPVRTKVEVACMVQALRTQPTPSRQEKQAALFQCLHFLHEVMFIKAAASGACLHRIRKREGLCNSVWGGWTRQCHFSEKNTV